VKLHALAKGELISSSIGGDLHRLRQQWTYLSVRSVGEEALDDVQDHRVGVAVSIDAGIGTPDVLVESDRECLRI